MSILECCRMTSEFEKCCLKHKSHDVNQGFYILKYIRKRKSYSASFTISLFLLYQQLQIIVSHSLCRETKQFIKMDVPCNSSGFVHKLHVYRPQGTNRGAEGRLFCMRIYILSEAHAVVFIHARSINNKSLVQDPPWLLRGVCCGLGEGTLSLFLIPSR